jgi:hypothetical protein
MLICLRQNRIACFQYKPIDYELQIQLREKSEKFPLEVLYKTEITISRLLQIVEAFCGDNFDSALTNAI